MGRIAKAKRHDSKMRARRQAKAAQKATYLAMRGTSKKSKKLRSHSSEASPHKHQHLVDDCGNVGCASCFPRFARIPHGSSHPVSHKNHYERMMAANG